MKDAFAAEVAAQGDNDAIREILEEVCRVTEMGFAAVARVTEDRWIACQVLDKIEFGLDPGDELNIKQTICHEIRDSGEAVIIDAVDIDEEWRTHPVPVLYGFKSYVSLPVYLGDGSFYGTLCAIDPARRSVTGAETIAVLEACARRVSKILSSKAEAHHETAASAPRLG